MNTVDSADNELNLLAIFHYILGGLTALFSFFPVIHLVIGILMVSGAFEGSDTDPAAAIFGWAFVIIPSILILAGLCLAVCIIIAGRKLKQCKSRTFCIVIAAIECAFVPFGTVLGVFTIVSLSKDSIKKKFDCRQT